MAPVFIFLWTLIPLLIWLQDRGPVFYRQKRKGKDGKVFTVTKFRTMVPGTEILGPTWTTERDPRVTKLGRMLRKRSLDELPQTISIWKGDMSFVGPRALEVSEHEILEAKIPDYQKRLQIQPGLTGLAQVYNRGDAAESKLRHDLEYVSKMSPWIDTKLLILSLRNTLLAKWDTRHGKQSMS